MLYEYRSDGGKNSIYLVDHAWTFRPEQVRQHLNVIPGLLERMCGLVVPDMESKDKAEQIEAVMIGMWKYCLTYSLGNETFGP